jgi:hypothetical protein
MAAPRPEADTGSRQVPRDEVPPTDDPRLDVLSGIAVRNAAEVARLARENDELRAHIGTTGDIVQLRGELADTTARLEAVAAELERLRAIPELKAGQRLRQVGRSIRHSSSEEQGTSPTPFVLPVEGAVADPMRPDAARSIDEPAAPPHVVNTTPDSLGYTDPAAPAVVMLVRNRRRGVEPLLAWLREHGVTEVELVDNASSDPATVELLRSVDAIVHRVDADLGVMAPWALGVMARLVASGDVLLVDGDTVPADGCPVDALARLSHELSRNPEADASEIVTAEPNRTARGRSPLFRLVRAGCASVETTIDLPPPYEVRCSSWDADDTDPDERYARFCDATRT